MPNPIVLAVNGGISTLAAVGSLFVKKGSDGKYNIAVAPLTLLVLIGTGVTCSVQKSEPFSVCVKSTTQSFKELIYAD